VPESIFCAEATVGAMAAAAKLAEAMRVTMVVRVLVSIWFLLG
jgi:hypothetical protein